MEESRIQISAENLAKLSKEELEDLKKRKVHVCLTEDSETSSKGLACNLVSQLESQIKESKGRAMPNGTQEPELLPFL